MILMMYSDIHRDWQSLPVPIQWKPLSTHSHSLENWRFFFHFHDETSWEDMNALDRILNCCVGQDNPASTIMRAVAVGRSHMGGPALQVHERCEDVACNCFRKEGAPGRIFKGN